MAKKYVSLSKLSTFLDNLRNTFASLRHSHTISDISDFIVDSALSSTSTNPVQNKVIEAEFEAISKAMNVYDTALDDKANITHSHSISEVTNLQTTLDNKADASHNHDSVYDAKGSANTALENANVYTDNAITQKTQVQIITWEDDD